jgi:hypothetical protein
MEPFFYQDGFMFNTDGDEVTTDEHGNFVLAVQEAPAEESAPEAAKKPAKAKPVPEVAPEVASEEPALPDLDNI